jgi:hypothetical protein
MSLERINLDTTFGSELPEPVVSSEGFCRRAADGEVIHDRSEGAGFFFLRGRINLIISK